MVYGLSAGRKNSFASAGLIVAGGGGTMAAMPTPADLPDLAAPARRFVREALGCGCSDEVLASMAVSLRAGPSPMTELKVGGRLLVHLRPCPAADRLPHLLAGWLNDGVAERDALGFNRFRLVLVGDQAEALRPLAEALFASQGGDDRTHLHLVSAGEAGPLAPA